MPFIQLFQWLGILSVLMFIGSLIAIPWIVSLLPVDYFIRHRLAIKRRRQRHPVLMRIVFIGRNIIGLLFVGAGIAMLLLPGQGILTILIGISVMDVPGKHKKIEWLVSKPRVKKTLNWIRSKKGKSLFEFE